jgi:hypothetical protein
MKRLLILISVIFVMQFGVEFSKKQEASPEKMVILPQKQQKILPSGVAKADQVAADSLSVTANRFLSSDHAN